MPRDLLAAMEARMREIAREEVAAAAGLADCFTSRGPLPPGVTARVFRETCRAGLVDGAVKDGRVWNRTRMAWFTARTRRPDARPSLVPSVPSDEERAAEFIRASGRRFVSGGEK